jgi:hypothetical protein
MKQIAEGSYIINDLLYWQRYSLEGGGTRLQVYIDDHTHDEFYDTHRMI